MEEKGNPFQYRDKRMMEELLTNVSVVLKDSDAAEDKEIVRRFLQEVSEAITFVAIGNSGVGKSSFLNRLFHDALFNGIERRDLGRIQEYRYGVEEAVLKVDEDVTRIFRKKEPLDGLQIIDTQGLDQAGRKETLERMKKYIGMSSVLFVLYAAQSVTDAAVWELLEGVEPRKVVFVLTKCDLVNEDTLQKNEARLHRYMKEAGIAAPVFRVSSQWESEGKTDKSGYTALRQYVAEQVIGENPILTKQRENFLRLKALMEELGASMEKRRKQYESDLSALEKIDLGMDAFLKNSQNQIWDLKEALRREIESEIDAYRREIIAKLDPHKIREYFPNGSTDFMDYLNLMNEGYRKRMTDNVNRKTQESIRGYLAELEKVFENAVGYLEKRSMALELEDRFYGTLAESKKGLVTRTVNDLEVTKDYYHSLSDASEELFMKLWKARNSRDRLVKNMEIAGGGLGAVAGAAGAGIAVHAVGTAAAGTAAMAAGTILWPIVGAIIGSLLIANHLRHDPFGNGKTGGNGCGRI